MISDEAVEAAVSALMINSGGALADVARKALEAAALYLLASAWDEGMAFTSGLLNAEELQKSLREDNPYRSQA